MAIDLHTHSMYSDGSDTPRQIVETAGKIGLHAVALTDHDTTAGLAEFMEAGQELGVPAIAGIELSCEYLGRDIHILGYGLPAGKPELENTLGQIREERTQRNQKMIRKLARLGYPLTYEEVESFASGSIVSRVHFAQALAKKGYVKSPAEAFQRLIGNDCPGYLPRKSLSIEEGVDFLIENGAQAVLAHPMLYKLTMEQIFILLQKMKARGASGVEVIHSRCRESDSRSLKKMAVQLGLGYTGGSDYHGRNKPGVYLGQGHNGAQIPDIFLKTLTASGMDRS